MIDGKVVGSQQILQLVKTFLVLVFLLGGWAFLGSIIVKLRQGSGKDRQGMAVKAKGLKA